MPKERKNIRKITSVFNPKKVNFIPDLKLSQLIDLKKDYSAESNRDLNENEKGLLIDYREYAIINLINGIIFATKETFWFKIVNLPPGWGDYVVIENENGCYKPKMIFERKTVKDLKSTIKQKKRSFNFDLLKENGKKENASVFLLLEASSIDRIFKKTEFYWNLKTKKEPFGISSYNIRCYINSLELKCLFSSSPIESVRTLINFLKKEKKTVLGEEVKMKRPQILNHFLTKKTF